MIPVTKPFLPPREIYSKLIDHVWKRNWLTNNGPLVSELESRLTDYLKVKHLLFTTNGTIALQLAIKALKLKGEIITTPFSYVATTSSIVWENCKPIFADIDENRLTIDPKRIEALITDKTSAILATHVYGIPCHVLEIESIAKRYNLKVIYDGAHAFGVLINNKSIFNYGDITTLSTHATKLFHTIEGGAVITNSPNLINKLSFLRNFGHDGFEKFSGIGINGKNSEFHAAMGIANFNYINEIIAKRKKDSEHYDSWFSNLNITRPKIPQNTEYNYSYYPVIFETEKMALKVFEELKKHEIFARRYFYPSLSHLNYVENQLTPVTDSIASKILCLPLFFDLSDKEIDYISRQIIRSVNN